MIPRMVNGVPTDPDVNTLIEAFGEPLVGTTIAYADVAKLIGVSVRSGRWNTVTQRWRKRLRRDFTLFLLCRAGDHFFVANENEKCDYSGAKQKHGLREIVGSAAIDATTDATQLSDTNRKAHEHRTMVNATILQTARQLSRRKRPALTQGVGH